MTKLEIAFITEEELNANVCSDGVCKKCPLYTPLENTQNGLVVHENCTIFLNHHGVCPEEAVFSSQD